MVWFRSTSVYVRRSALLILPATNTLMRPCEFWNTEDLTKLSFFLKKLLQAQDSHPAMALGRKLGSMRTERSNVHEGMSLAVQVCVRLLLTRRRELANRKQGRIV